MTTHATSYGIAIIILLALFTFRSSNAIPIRKSVESFPDRFEDLFVLPNCRMLPTIDIAGFDIFGNPVRGAICSGTCPRKDDLSECPWGCAPSDYSVCSCASGGRTACETHQDQTGDLVCAWDNTANVCTGCNALTNEADCSAQVNCRWASDGVCMARGQTTSPTCDGQGKPCEGHSEEECGDEATNAEIDRECQATGFKIAFKFGVRGTLGTAQTTSEPKTLVTRTVDLDTIADREEPLPGGRHGRDLHDETPMWVNGISCDADVCKPVYGQKRMSKNSVTEAFCMQLISMFSDDEHVLSTMNTDGRARNCVSVWASKKLLGLVKVPTSCDCQ